MEVLSTNTLNPDAYEAGIDLAERVQEIDPEILFLFTSVNYDFDELFEGLRTVLGPNPLIFGGTGDGIYETQGARNQGAALLALNSGGRIRWKVGLGHPGSEKKEIGAEEIQKAFDQCQPADPEKVQLYTVLADFHTDGVLLTETLRALTDRPLLGGLNGDNWVFEQAYTFAFDKAWPRAVALLSWETDDPGALPFLIHSGTGWKPLGRLGRVQHAQGNTLYTIEGQSAYQFLTHEIGRPPTETELGTLPLAAYKNDVFTMRTPYEIDINRGSLTYFGRIEEGTPVQVCTATREDILEGVSQLVREISPLPFKPRGALVFSCGGRKWVLDDQVAEELNLLMEGLGGPLPLAGFPSFGEIGPLYRGSAQPYTESLFHNVSLVVMVFR